MERFGTLWSNKGSQEPDPGVTTDNEKEKANVQCIINKDLITLCERLGMVASGERQG